MAAGKPIVSTAVADVVRNFTPVVSVASTRPEFVATVERLSKERDEALIADGIAMAARASWESIVERMRSLIANAVDDSLILDAITSDAPVVGAAEAESPQV
jgi:hypothetical protein